MKHDPECCLHPETLPEDPFGTKDGISSPQTRGGPDDDDFVLDLDADPPPSEDTAVPEAAIATESFSKLTTKSIPVPKKHTPAPMPPAPIKQSLPTAPMPRTRPQPPTQTAKDSEMNFLQKNKAILIVSAGLLAAAIFGIAYLFSGDDAKTQLAEMKTNFTGDLFAHSSEREFTSEEYWQRYSRNNAQANLDFDETTVQLTGKVRNAISEGSKNVLLLETSSSTHGIECQFSSKDTIANIQVGSEVVIVGQGTARKQPKTDDVVLINCRIKQ